MSPENAPPNTNTVKTRILILSDTHSSSPSPSSAQHLPFRTPLPVADVLLHCGDLTYSGQLPEYEKALQMLESIDAPLKLVIAGNHDGSLDGEWFQQRGGWMHRMWSRVADQGLSAEEAEREVEREKQETIVRAREMWTGERARRAGVTYLEEGTYEFLLGNGGRLRVYASPYTPEFCNFAFPYARREDRFNPPHQCTPRSTPIAVNPIPDFPALDVIMTHGPPHGILDATRSGPVGCQHLLRAARRAKPKLYCFGHIHEAWGAERVTWAEGEDLDVGGLDGHVLGREGVEVDVERMRRDRGVVVDVSSEGGRALEWGRETLMVNASIMTVRYHPEQGPWVVDLDLERAG